MTAPIPYPLTSNCDRCGHRLTRQGPGQPWRTHQGDEHCPAAPDHDHARAHTPMLYVLPGIGVGGITPAPAAPAGGPPLPPPGGGRDAPQMRDALNRLRMAALQQDEAERTRFGAAMAARRAPTADMHEQLTWARERAAFWEHVERLMQDGPRPIQDAAALAARRLLEEDMAGGRQTCGSLWEAAARRTRQDARQRCLAEVADALGLTPARLTVWWACTRECD